MQINGALECSLDVRVQGQEEEGDGQSVCVCFVAGEQEGECVACDGRRGKIGLRKEIWKIFIRAWRTNEVEVVCEPRRLACLTAGLWLWLLTLMLLRRSER